MALLLRAARYMLLLEQVSIRKDSQEMLRSLAGYLKAGLAVVLTVTPLAAHHAIPAKFDPGKPGTLSGLVTSVDWRNPHAHVLIS